MATLLLTSLSPFMAWGLWATLTFVIAWLMAKGVSVLDWMLGL